jgi:integrase
MSESNSSKPSTPSKPQRPEGDTTLFWHASGRWAKKIRGKLSYFGRGTYQEALDLYAQQKDALHSGRLPREDEPEGLTVYLLCAKFLTTKTLMVKSGDLAQRSLDDYAATCKLVIKAFGRNRLVSDLGPDDFEKLRKRMSKTWGPVRLGNEINRVRVIFSYGFKNGHLDRPMVFGEGFRRPSKKTLRLHRDSRGAKMFEVADLRRMLAAAGQPLRTMILLGMNCGYGNSDIATLPLSALDLDGGWASYPRPKTAVRRRCPLWPETVATLREWLAERPVPKDAAHAGLVFITKYGSPWDIENRSLSNETRKLLDSLDISGHRNFYALRHTFQTVADEAGDPIVTRRLMGHVRDDDMGDVYRERVSDERLKKVTDHVRGWLLSEKPKA